MAPAMPYFGISVPIHGQYSLERTVCLATSTYCYIRIFFRLRQQQTQVHINRGDPENQTTRADMSRYRKTVFSALWLQLALLFCYLPYSVLAPFALREIENTSSHAIFMTFMTTITLVFLNSNLNEKFVLLEDHRG